VRFILQRYPNKSIVMGVEKPASEEIPKDPGGHPWLSQITIGFATSVAATLALYYAGFFENKKK